MDATPPLKKKFYRHFFNTSSVLFVASASLSIIQSHLQPEEFVPSERIPKINSAAFFRFSTLGYWPAAVDWMWIQTLQIVGTDVPEKGIVQFASTFYEMATDLDPKFFELYEQAGTYFSFSLNAPEESIHFLEKALRANERFGWDVKHEKGWDRAYLLSIVLAYVYAYQKNDWEKAKDQYLKTADMPGAPAYLQEMRVWLREENSEKILAQRVLKILIRSTVDEALRAKYEEKLRAL